MSEAAYKIGLRMPLLSLMLCVVLPAHADRDIVYSARYYYPPTSHQVSHFHLYRINPNGTGRKQLTWGRLDDLNPLWSPEDQRILFLRSQPDGRKDICLIKANGGRVRRLVSLGPDTQYTHYGWSPDGRWMVYTRPVSLPTGYEATMSQVVLYEVQTGRTKSYSAASAFTWSPDSRRLYLWLRFPADNNSHDRLLSPRDDHLSRFQTQLDHPIWLDGRTITGVLLDARGSFLRVVGVDGKERRRFRFREMYEPQKDEDQVGWRLWSAIPSAKTEVVCALNMGHDLAGAMRVYRFYRADTVKGKMKFLSEGREMSWSSDGKTFCAIPPTGLGLYGRNRRVYVSPLQIVSGATGKLRSIVSGLAWVWSADWHKREEM